MAWSSFCDISLDPSSRKSKSRWCRQQVQGDAVPIGQNWRADRYIPNLHRRAVLSVARKHLDRGGKLTCKLTCRISKDSKSLLSEIAIQCRNISVAHLAQWNAIEKSSVRWFPFGLLPSSLSLVFFCCVTIARAIAAVVAYFLLLRHNCPCCR